MQQGRKSHVWNRDGVPRKLGGLKKVRHFLRSSEQPNSETDNTMKTQCLFRLQRPMQSFRAIWGRNTGTIKSKKRRMTVQIWPTDKKPRFKGQKKNKKLQYMHSSCRPILENASTNDEWISIPITPRYQWLHLSRLVFHPSPEHTCLQLQGHPRFLLLTEGHKVWRNILLFLLKK